jgi:hypothetical protein
VHCHDWQSAPVAWLDHGTAKCAFTIHNLNYGADLIGQVGPAGLAAGLAGPERVGLLLCSDIQQQQRKRQRPGILLLHPHLQPGSWRRPPLLAGPRPASPP